MSGKIISKPPTPEYEASYNRVFGEKKCIISYQEMQEMDEVSVASRLIKCGFDSTKEIHRRDEFEKAWVVFWQ